MIPRRYFQFSTSFLLVITTATATGFGVHSLLAWRRAAVRAAEKASLEQELLALWNHGRPEFSLDELSPDDLSPDDKAALARYSESYSEWHKRVVELQARLREFGVAPYEYTEAERVRMALDSLLNPKPDRPITDVRSIPNLAPSGMTAGCIPVL